jgi:ActR/RegA family two-component response regulator
MVEGTAQVVDDDASMRDSLRRLITSLGFKVDVFPSARAFLGARRPDVPGCLVLDVRLPGLSGLDLERELAPTDAELPIIFITGHGDIDEAVPRTGAARRHSKRHRARPHAARRAPGSHGAPPPVRVAHATRARRDGPDRGGPAEQADRR